MLDGQALLDEITGAVLAGDFDRYLRHTAVPLVIVAPSSTFVLETQDKLWLGFSRAHEMYRTLKVTDLIRRLRTQAPVGSRLVSLAFETHVMRGADRICAPYACTALARRELSGWKVAMLADSLTNEEWPIVVPMPEEAG